MIDIVVKPNILVIGDLMIDEYLWGECNRISPEAPVVIADIKKETKQLGGAGNVVNNLFSLGANVTVLSVVGDDENSNILQELFDDINIEYRFIYSKERLTSKKTRIIASNQQVIRFDKESCFSISKDEEDSLIKEFDLLIKDSYFDVIILSDYAKGVLTKKVIQHIINNKKNIKVLVDPKGEDYLKYKGAYLLTPNKKELSIALKKELKDRDDILKALQEAKKRFDLDVSLVTLSQDGIAFLEDEFIISPTFAKEVFDVTGAGDTVIAALAIAISQNYPIKEAVEFANLSAGVVVGKIGSATVTLKEVESYESSLHKSSSISHIKQLEELEEIVKYLKSSGKKIVFTNGCFDILHVGHVSYLEKAKSFGDILIVGLNSDESVKKLKGEDRPINSQFDRAYLLASLESVDYVVIFNEDTPYNIISKLKPDVLVKGGDYKDKEVVGSDIVEKVELIDFVDGKSTSNIIEKIKNNVDSNSDKQSC